MLDPTKYPLRSPLYRQHIEKDATFCALGETTLIVEKFSEDDTSAFKNLSIIDLSPLPRVGFKGKNTPEWLQQQAIELPPNPNEAIRLNDGTLVARLSSNEFLFLSDIQAHAETNAKLRQWTLTDNQLCYILNRDHSHSWFALTGQFACATLSKVCGINFHDDASVIGSLAQTSVARITSIIIKDEIKNTPVFHILSDSASAEYMYACLLDAMAEFSGKPAGVSVLT